MVMTYMSMFVKEKGCLSISLLLSSAKLLRQLSISIQFKLYIEILNLKILWLCYVLKVKCYLTPQYLQTEVQMNKILKILKLLILGWQIIYLSFKIVKKGMGLRELLIILLHK